MFGLLCATAFAASLAWFIVSATIGLRKNIKAAKESGLQWFVARKSSCCLLSSSCLDLLLHEEVC